MAATVRATSVGTSDRGTQASDSPSPQAPPHAAPHELPALDGLRALAILLVLWHHIYRWGPGDWSIWKLPILRASADFGFIGVLLFFVLSGFLLFLPYARALVDGGRWPSARSFYRRRALRILPVYFVALAVLAALVTAAHAWRPWMAHGFVFTALLAQNISLSASNLVGVLDGPLWTLAIEWQFYLILPGVALIVLWLTRGRSRRVVLRRTTLALSIVILFGLAIRVVSAILMYGPSGGQAASTAGWSGILLRVVGGRYLEEFALGMLLSLAYAAVSREGRLALRRVTWAGAFAGVLVLPGLVACYLWAQRLDVFRAENDWGFIPGAGWSWIVLGVWATTLCFALLLAAALFGPGAFKWALSLPPLRFIGLISYSIYVWHLPIINLVRNTTAAVIVILLLSVVSYYVIERPFLRRRYASRGERKRMAQRMFEQEIFVDAEPPVVIGYLASYAHHDAIHPMIVAVRELDPRRTAEGTIQRRYAITDRMRLGPLTTRFTYLATIYQEVDGELVSDAYQFPRIHLRNRTRCEASGTGTLIREHVTVEAPRPLLGFVARQAETAHRAMLANLKALVESAMLAERRS